MLGWTSLRRPNRRRLIMANALLLAWSGVGLCALRSAHADEPVAARPSADFLAFLGAGVVDSDGAVVDALDMAEITPELPESEPASDAPTQPIDAGDSTPQAPTGSEAKR